jgi:hypothetical protein
MCPREEPAATNGLADGVVGHHHLVLQGGRDVAGYLHPGRGTARTCGTRSRPTAPAAPSSAAPRSAAAADADLVRPLRADWPPATSPGSLVQTGTAHAVSRCSTRWSRPARTGQAAPAGVTRPMNVGAHVHLLRTSRDRRAEDPVDILGAEVSVTLEPRHRQPLPFNSGNRASADIRCPPNPNPLDSQPRESLRIRRRPEPRSTGECPV